MATLATIGKWKLTHEAAEVEEVLSVGGMGKSNNLVDVTNFDSPGGSMEYIAGLADGTEISVECNYVPAATAQIALRADVDAGATAAFVMTYDGSVTFTFNAVCMGYVITPSTSEQNKCSYTLKISGDITEGTIP